MEPAAILAELLALAREAGIEVRPLPAAPPGEGEPPAASGVCRVRGRVWVLLARGDPPDVQIEALSRALREGAAEWLEGRWLPPALRDRLASTPGDVHPGGGRAAGR